MIADLARAITELRADVDQLIAQASRPSTGPFRPVDWTSLDQDEAAVEWARLTGFVDRLLDRYRLDETIPECWPQHPAITEELSALHIAWLAAYTDPTAPADAGNTWHDALERTLSRTREWNRTGCTGDIHRPEPVARPRVQNRLDAIIANEISARPASGFDDVEQRHATDPQAITATRP